MRNAIKAEFRKLTYSKPYYLVIFAASFLATLSAAPAPFAMAKLKGGSTGISFMDSEVINGIYGKALSGYVFALILGIMIMTNEFRYGTATATFLATPNRKKVVAAKLLIAAGAGVILQLVALIFGFGGAYFGLLPYQHAQPTMWGLLSLVTAAILSGAILPIIGVAVGTLIRNQQIATSGSMIYLFIVERLLVVFWPSGGKYLPSGLITSMMNLNLHLTLQKRLFTINTADYLSFGPATMLLLLYGLVFAFVAISTTLRRDV